MHGIPIVITKQTPFGKVSITTKLNNQHSIHPPFLQRKFKTQHQQDPSTYQPQMNQESLYSGTADSITDYETKANPKNKQNRLRIKRIQSSRSRKRFPKDFFLREKQEQDQKKVSIPQTDKKPRAELEECFTPKFVVKQSAKDNGRIFQTQKLHGLQKGSSSKTSQIKVFSIRHKKKKSETHRKIIENVKSRDNSQINNLTIQSIKIPDALPNKNHQNTTFGKKQWSSQKQNLFEVKGHERESIPSFRSVNVPKIYGGKERTSNNLLGKITMRQ